MKTNSIVRFALGVLLILCIGGTAWADGAKAIAVIVSVKGDSQVKKGEAAWTTARFGTVLDNDDQIRTGEDGFMALVFTDDKSQLKVRPFTELTLNGERDEEYNISKRVNMEIGELFADVTQQKGSLQVATPTSVASVKGTEFWVIVENDGETQLLTLEGIVEFISLLTGESVDVSSGGAAVATPNGDVTTSSIDETEIPDILEDLLELKTIEIRFIDEDGNEKVLTIQYQEEAEE